MSVDVGFYFQVHQPWRLRQYRFLEVGKNHQYFDEEKNSQILRKVADKCYLPMNNLLLDLLQDFDGDFKVSFSITGTVLEQMDAYAPEAIASFKRLFETGRVELLSETSHHSLAALYSPEEFREQVRIHRETCIRLLGVEPSKVFRNTELITSNAIAKQVSEMGYEGILMEGADHVLRWKSPLFPYQLAGAPHLMGLMKNYRLSDDIAFRFSDRNWPQWPLTIDKYSNWIQNIEKENPVTARGGTPFVGLFMDYETFGEHQWASTGIFDFMRELPANLLKSGSARFITASEGIAQARDWLQSEKGKGLIGQIDAKEPFSWADVERDLSAWSGNPIQDAALDACYQLEAAVKDRALALGDSEGAELLETWRRLTTSDHFYYMCTKYFADGDVHKYFNPYESPYDAHIIYMNVLADLSQLVGIEERAIA